MSPSTLRVQKSLVRALRVICHSTLLASLLASMLLLPALPLTARAMEGNTLRKHAASSSYSDPRFAEIGDQLGMMYVWVPTGWARKQWTEVNKNPDGSKIASKPST